MFFRKKATRNGTFTTRFTTEILNAFWALIMKIGNKNECRKDSASPLLEYAEGQRQQERNDLIAAVTILSRRNRRHSPTDLHVRELLTFVDRKGERVNGVETGINLSYDAIATLLLCEPRTARYVVDRAVMEFGLLVPGDTFRYNAQGPNNYRINREAVRLAVTIARDLPAPPVRGDTECHPPDTECHPPDTECHPTPYNNSLLVSQIEETTTTKSFELVRVERSRNQSVPSSHGPEWKVVVVALFDEGVSLIDRAISGAKALGFSPDRCMELVMQFRELPDSKRDPGVLYRWLTMARSAPRKPRSRVSKSKPFNLEQAKQRHWFVLRSARLRKGPLNKGEAEQIEQEAERLAREDQRMHEAKEIGSLS